MKKFSIFVFSFLVLLQSKLFALLPEFEQLYPVNTVVTQDNFFERFEYRAFIASGGESQVFKVCEKETNKEYALVVYSQYYGLYNDSISYEAIVRRKSLVERMIQLQKFNPHQAVIHAYFWIKTMSLTRHDANLYNVREYYVNRYDPIPDGRFFNELSLNDVNTNKFKSLPEEIKGTLNCCMLLELGEADLESEEYKKKEIDKKLENLATQISSHFITHAGIVHCDYKLRNHIYIKSENVFYGNRAMSDYQYWHYVVNGKHFYIPALPIVIKRIDYASWYLSMRDLTSNFEENNYSSRFFDNNDFSLYREKPDVADDQILDILNYMLE